MQNFSKTYKRFLDNYWILSAFFICKFYIEMKDKIDTSDHTYIRIKQTFVEYSSHDKGINKLHSKQRAFNPYYLWSIFYLVLGELLHFFTYFGHFYFFRQWVGQDSTKLVHF